MYRLSDHDMAGLREKQKIIKTNEKTKKLNNAWCECHCNPLPGKVEGRDSMMVGLTIGQPTPGRVLGRISVTLTSVVLTMPRRRDGGLHNTLGLTQISFFCFGLWASLSARQKFYGEEKKCGNIVWAVRMRIGMFLCRGWLGPTLHRGLVTCWGVSPAATPSASWPASPRASGPSPWAAGTSRWSRIWGEEE